MDVAGEVGDVSNLAAGSCRQTDDSAVERLRLDVGGDTTFCGGGVRLTADVSPAAFRYGTHVGYGLYTGWLPGCSAGGTHDGVVDRYCCDVAHLGCLNLLPDGGRVPRQGSGFQPQDDPGLRLPRRNGNPDPSLPVQRPGGMTIRKRPASSTFDAEGVVR